MQDYIKENGLFYKLSKKQKSYFIHNQLYTSVLPGDLVEYNEIEDKINIIRIVEREERLTLGILKNNILSLPLLSSIFIKKIDKKFDIKQNTPYFVLCKVNKDYILIKKIYCETNQRQCDLQIIQHIYYRDFNFENIYHNLIKNLSQDEPYYLNKRIDLTHLNTFNIDPENSLDFDDAISVDIESNTIYIHIVDINHYLPIETQEEKRAFELGFTLYTPEGNMNILPSELSEDKFSLIEGKNKKVITIEIQLEKNMNIKKYYIYPSKINIKKRYSYESSYLEKDTNKDFIFLKKLLDNETWKYKSFNIPSKIFSFDNNDINIHIKDSHVMNKIIECLMIKTNYIITDFLRDKTFIPERYHPKTNIINQNVTNDSIINTIIEIKKYKTAFYSSDSEQKGHFGLNLEKYTHFTSPIRRGLDILVHRILGGVKYKEEDLKKVIEYLNQREKLNEKLIDFYQKCKILSYFDKNQNKEYICYINSVTKYGIHIFIPSILYSDFIHISSIDKNTRWIYEKDRLYFDTKELIVGKELKVKFLKINWVKLNIEEYQVLF